MNGSSPKVFVSYSWTSPEHRELIRGWADRLLADGIEVVLDIYDLKEGDDKNVFMESMVADPSVTHVLVICDKEYTSKADKRQAGVGAESQIISESVYEKVKQSKFIPIVCEFDADGDPCIPAFLKSRIYFDFSSLESVNENWESLIRLLFDKPLYQKPRVGRPPSYVDRSSTNTPIFSSSSYPSLRQAITQQQVDVAIRRADFLAECFEFADSLRIRSAPKDRDELSARIVADCGKLKDLRNYLVDWVQLESGATSRDVLDKVLIDFLERLRELKSRPSDLTTWHDKWFGAQSMFVYETFLYVVAALIQAEDFRSLNRIFKAHYLVPETERYGDHPFTRFDCFYGYATGLDALRADGGQKYLSPGAELIRRQADRQDIKFEAIMEAELVILLMTLLTPNTFWYPGTLLYASYMNKSSLFLKATRHREFRNLAILTDIEDADQLRTAVMDGHSTLERLQGANFPFRLNLLGMMNLDKLDTLE